MRAGPVPRKTGIINFLADCEREFLRDHRRKVNRRVVDERVRNPAADPYILRRQHHVVGRHVAVGRLGVFRNEVRRVPASATRNIERRAGHRDDVRLLRNGRVFIDQADDGRRKRLGDEHAALAVVVARQGTLLHVLFVPRPVFRPAEHKPANPASARLGVAGRLEAAELVVSLRLAGDRDRLGGLGHLDRGSGSGHGTAEGRDLVGDRGFAGEVGLDLVGLGDEFRLAGLHVGGPLFDLGVLFEQPGEGGSTILKLGNVGGHPWRSVMGER